MRISCKTIRPVAKIKAESKGGSVMWLNNVSNYNDKSCDTSSRLVKWVIAKGGHIVKDFGFHPVATIIPLGTSSNGEFLKLDNSAQTVWDYLTTTLGFNLSNGDIYQIGLFVKNCFNETSRVSALYTLPPFGGCTDCCCDNLPYYVFQQGGIEFCATVTVGGVEECLVY